MNHLAKIPTLKTRDARFVRQGRRRAHDYTYDIRANGRL